MYYKLITFIFLSILNHVAHGLSLTSEVDRTTIASNESLRLVITADESASEVIDFSQLTHQFDIINQQQSTQTSILNGQVSSNTQWILILSPKETGQLIIPSFEYRRIYSPAITITVTETPQAQDKNNSNPDVFFQIENDKESVYVQQQLLLTMRLYYKIALSGYDDEELKLDNTAIELVSEKNFKTKFRGKNYNVLEKVYALHPQSVGDLNIPAQSWRLEKSLRSFNFGRSGNPYLYVRSEPLTIQVKSIPETNTAKNWLPSEKISLEGRWKQSILRATVGEPLNYQLALSGNGLTAAQLPEITIPKTDDFTIYTDQSEANNTKDISGITGERTSNFAVIPRKAGTFTFPETMIKWWNIKTDKEENFILPEQTIIVANSIAAKNEALPSLPSTPNITVSEADRSSTVLWQIISTILLLAVIALSFLLYNSKKGAILATTLKAHKSTPLRDNSVSSSLQVIQNAVDHQDWGKLRHAIIQWGKISCRNSEINSLSEIANQLPELKLHLLQLDNKIYGQRIDETYDPSPLIQLIRAFRFKEKLIKKNHLKDLYHEEQKTEYS